MIYVAAQKNTGGSSSSILTRAIHNGSCSSRIRAAVVTSSKLCTYHNFKSPMFRAGNIRNGFACAAPKSQGRRLRKASRLAGF
jgi:hypothetical protein